MSHSRKRENQGVHFVSVLAKNESDTLRVDIKIVTSLRMLGSKGDALAGDVRGTGAPAVCRVCYIYVASAYIPCPVQTLMSNLVTRKHVTDNSNTSPSGRTGAQCRYRLGLIISLDQLRSIFAARMMAPRRRCSGSAALALREDCSQ